MVIGYASLEENKKVRMKKRKMTKAEFVHHKCFLNVGKYRRAENLGGMTISP